MNAKPDFSRLSDADLRLHYRRQESFLTYTMEAEMRRCYLMQELVEEGQRRGIEVWDRKAA